MMRRIARDGPLIHHLFSFFGGQEIESEFRGGHVYVYYTHVAWTAVHQSKYVKLGQLGLLYMLLKVQHRAYKLMLRNHALLEVSFQGDLCTLSIPAY